MKGVLELPTSLEYLGQEIDNIRDACNIIAQQQITDQSTVLTAEKIKEYNRLVLANLTLQKGVIPGEIRRYQVGVARYRGAPAEDCEYLLERLCEWLSSKLFRPPKALNTIFSVIKAIVAHVYLAWIHPLGDGNGRTARLVEFQILIGAGVPLPAAHLLSNHYNQTRQEYYRQLEQTSQSGGDLLPFIQYAVQGFVDGLRGQLSLIREQQLDVAWRNFVHEQFRDQNKPADVRCRHLILDLSRQAQPIPISKLGMITPRVAASYANKTLKAMRRDVKKLVVMGLAEMTTNGVRARREVISAFLPLRRIDPRE
jgi:Fic family protein